MSFVVTIECFKGFHHLSNQCVSGSRLQDYIDRYENEYLCRLLGSELHQLLLEDLVEGAPENEDYLEWFNPFCEELDSCCNSETVLSRGLKDMLTGFIYYFYVHDSQIIQSQTGSVMNNSHNSTQAGMINNERVADRRYNESVETYNAISAKLGNCKRLDYKVLDL